MGAVVYCFPVSIGDTVYIEQAGHMETCQVAGFQILEQGIYVYVRYPDIRLKQLVLLSNIRLTPGKTENKFIKEEQMYEESTDGRG